MKYENQFNVTARGLEWDFSFPHSSQYGMDSEIFIGFQRTGEENGSLLVFLFIHCAAIAGCLKLKQVFPALLEGAGT